MTQIVKTTFGLFMMLLLLNACDDMAGGSDNARTISGYDFTRIENSVGATPQIDDFIFFDLTVTSNDSMIQSSHQQGQPFSVKISDDKQMYGAFAPVIDMIRSMSVGDSSVLYFPKDSFGQVSPAMASLADIINYEVVLKEIMNADAYKAYQDSLNTVKMAEAQVIQAREPEVKALMDGIFADFQAGKLDADMKSTETGLRYYVHDEGNTSRPVDNGMAVGVLYYGTLQKDNSMFDNAFKRGAPYVVNVGRGAVIRGWDIGLAELNYGSKATFFIPSELGYGEAGSPPNIGPGDDLIFYVELVE